VDRSTLVGILAAVVLTVSGCTGESDGTPDGDADISSAQPSATYTLGMQDISFDRAEIGAEVGEVIEIAVENRGAIEHDFTIREIDADWAVIEGGDGAASGGHGGHGAEYAVHVAVAPGKRAVLRLDAHHPGSYEYLCSVPGHEQLGMRGVLKVG
jgi:uncharacterized cupredoxin-like copper-binding protein